MIYRADILLFDDTDISLESHCISNIFKFIRYHTFFGGETIRLVAKTESKAETHIVGFELSHLGFFAYSADDFKFYPKYKKDKEDQKTIVIENELNDSDD